MRNLSEYLRAYRAYVSASVGWVKALMVMLIWLSGIFVPLGVRTFIFELSNWLAIAWMVSWSLLGYIFAPYGMWKYHRAQIAGPGVGRNATQALVERTSSPYSTGVPVSADVSKRPSERPGNDPSHATVRI